jgi:hypothetical protein
MLQVFVSYSRNSEALVKALVADLDELGHGVWFDKDLVGGQAWWDQILGRIRACDVLVFVLDEKSLASGACRAEWLYAAALGKSILPVLVADGVSNNLLPPALQQTQFVDYRRQDRQAALRLARALADSPPAGGLPDPLPVAPDLPISYLGRLGHEIDSLETLGRERQSALLVDLKRALRDAETIADAQALLARMRKRHDLLMTIGEEIDELLSPLADFAGRHRVAAPASAASPPPDAAPMPPAQALPEREMPQALAFVVAPSAVPEATRLAPAAATPRAAWGWKSIPIAGIAGATVGLGAAAMLPVHWDAGVMLGFGALIGMAIGRPSHSAPRAIAVGAFVGWAALSLLLTLWIDRYALSAGATLGAPLGAILGGVVARLRSRRDQALAVAAAAGRREA